LAELALPINSRELGRTIISFSVGTPAAIAGSGRQMNRSCMQLTNASHSDAARFAIFLRIDF
jgi:hypothetical protein